MLFLADGGCVEQNGDKKMGLAGNRTQATCNCDPPKASIVPLDYKALVITNTKSFHDCNEWLTRMPPDKGWPSNSRLHLSLAINMLSDPSYTTFPFDIPVLPDISTPYPEDDPFAPLNFDGLLDIACEFEFTHTINHVWPCEEEPNACPDTGLDDLLAAIVPTPNAEESPIPLSSPVPSMSIDPTHVQAVDLHSSTSDCPAPDANGSIPVSLPKDNDQVQTQATFLMTPTLQGWSPPHGSRFLDLDDSLMLPQPEKDTWNSPWLAMFLDPSSTQPMNDITQAFAMVSTIHDMQPQTPGTMPKPLPASTTDGTANKPRKKSTRTPIQPSTRVILDPVRLQSAANQTVVDPHAKAPRSRPHLSSTPAMAGASNYGRAPRGGIPPHIARSVTKANILRVEKERKVMQDAFSNTVTGETKKPSVLQRVAKVEKGPGKDMNGGKQLVESGENARKEGRAAKRARL